MSILTREKYRKLTRDNVSEGKPLQDAIDVSQELIEDILDRKLEQADVIDETVVAYRHKSGFYTAYPDRMPVTAVTTPGWEFTNTGILKSASSGFSIVYNLDYTEQVGPNQYEVIVSYTGGFTALTAPARLLLAIARYAQYIIKQSDNIQKLPVGISSMSVGGVSISRSSAATESLSIPKEITGLLRGFARRKY